ncbi:DUF4384 domain-containing protein [Bradyrhizobium sp. AZCC 2289]|uniref:DUF4384 domain-containing protein n=1 Tax=Bradyrhizobium sp. AZCC 2289 TaxID=3117026 RepID=UPI002FEF3D18
MRFATSIAVLGFFLTTAAPTFAEEDPGFRDLSVEQVKAYHAGSQKQSSLKLTASVNRRDMTYARGETLKLRVQTNEDAYVTVFNVGPTGKITQLFPNSFQKDNLVKANSETEIPSPNGKAEIKISGDLGGEVIKIFASDKPLKLVPETMLSSGEVFVAVKSDVGEFVRNLEVTTAAPTTSGQKISIVNMAVKTVASR